jgi:hypothetical protein
MKPGEKMHFQKLLLCLVVIAFALPMTSYAEIQLSARGAADLNSNNYGFVNSPSLLLGGDLTFGISDLFQLGATYQHNSLSYPNGGGSTSSSFYGGLVRVGTMTPIFGDAQVGIDTVAGSSNSLSWGLGAGFKIPIAIAVDLSPRVGYRYVPYNGVTASQIDIGLLLTFSIF